MRVVTRTLSVAGMLTLGFGLTACGGAPPPLRLHADVKQIMAAIVDPAADVVWESVGTIDTIEGTEHIRPQDDQEWTETAHAAWVVTEAANALMIGNRPRDAGDWMTFAQDLADNGLRAARAAEAHDAEALFTAGGDMYLACTACHAKYNITLTAPVTQ
jgi:hypothetical protein